jgi:hypothetical protein
MPRSFGITGRESRRGRRRCGKASRHRRSFLVSPLLLTERQTRTTPLGSGAFGSSGSFRLGLSVWMAWRATFEQYAAQSAPPTGSAADAKAFASYIRKGRRRPLFRR